jgi:hypothetical protein
MPGSWSFKGYLILAWPRLGEALFDYTIGSRWLATFHVKQQQFQIWS